MIYLANNVFDEAIERVRMIYDHHDDVIVSMSGGKDSTVLFHIALMVAKEKNRLPVKVFWLDQEAEWKATVEYMEKIMRMPEVNPYWFQVPYEATNTLSPQKNFMYVWREEDRRLWVHEQSPLAIKENPSKETRFHELVNELPKYCTESDDCAVLVGMRSAESLNRRAALQFHSAQWHGYTWCKKKSGRTQTFWPIYDFTNDDIWTAIAKNGWEYNAIYDMQYQWGLPKQNMRVSSLIHETAWHSINGMSNIVMEMLINGASDLEVCNELGLEAEELVRLKHITGYAKLYENNSFTKAAMSENQVAELNKYREAQDGDRK